MSDPPTDHANTEVPVRICPVCSAQSQTTSDRCPHCGSSFIRSRRVRLQRRMAGLSSTSKAALIGGFVLLLLAGAGLVVALKVDHDRSVEAEREAEEEARAAAAAAAAEQEAAE